MQVPWDESNYKSAGPEMESRPRLDTTFFNNAKTSILLIVHNPTSVVASYSMLQTLSICRHVFDELLRYR